MLPANVVRILTLISGVLAIVLGAVNQLGLPVAFRSTIAVVGGVLLAILAYLEHPTTVSRMLMRLPARQTAPPEPWSPPTTPTAPGMANPR